MTLASILGNPSGSPGNLGTPLLINTPAPASYAAGASQTLTADDVLGGIVVFAGNGNSASTVTLPTAALLAAAMRTASNLAAVAVGNTVSFRMVNGAATGATGLVTVSPGSGGALDANQAAATLVTGMSKTINLRFTNGALSSEAYVVYC